MKSISGANEGLGNFILAGELRAALSWLNWQGLAVGSCHWLRALLGGTDDDALVTVAELAGVTAGNIFSINDLGAIVNTVGIVRGGGGGGRGWWWGGSCNFRD
jgi:hypothetical protein